jgi:hypothetical protein
MKRNPGSTWLVTLKSRALEGWIYQNEPRLMMTVFIMFDSSYGFDAPAVDRSFVVSASDRRDAIQRGLAAFNAAAAKSYSPISAAAVERVAPGPVYLAEIIKTETGETTYLPFTQSTIKDVEAFVRKEYFDPSDATVQAAGYSRSPTSLGRSFVPGTAEHEAYLDFVGATEAAAHEEMEEDLADATDNLEAVMRGRGRGEIQTAQQQMAQQSHMDIWSIQAQREYLDGAHTWTKDMIKAYESAKEQDFFDAQMSRNSESRRRGLGSVRLASLSADLAPVKATRRLTNGRSGRRR